MAHLAVISCPYYGGTGTVTNDPPVPLSPAQTQIYNAVRRAPAGLTAPQIVEKIYSARYDGGPTNARTVVYLTIRAANRRLRLAGVEIASTTRTRGGTYQIQPIGEGVR